MPTIRIDDEVYEWLQSHAKAFEDTPNTALRRIAGLKEGLIGEDGKVAEVRRKQASPRRSGLSGRLLNEEWKVGASHALYHKDGRWFNNLERFPGALFDPYGYVSFETKKEYLSCSGVNVCQETNVSNGIESLPNYVRVKS